MEFQNLIQCVCNNVNRRRQTYRAIARQKCVIAFDKQNEHETLFKVTFPVAGVYTVLRQHYNEPKFQLVQ